MEIFSVLQGLQSYKQSKPDKADGPAPKGREPSRGSTPGDSVRVSDKGRLVNNTLRAAQQAPDVRKQKIQELKEKVQSGTYEPDIRRTAAKLVEEDLDLLF